MNRYIDRKNVLRTRASLHNSEYKQKSENILPILFFASQYFTKVSTEVAFNSLHAGYFFMLSLSSADLFSKLTLFSSKYSSRNTIRVPNGFDPYQDRLSVGPDLGPNCIQKLSAGDKGMYQRK